jgi:sensor histidine kinase regulating citrate/malate metabolism
MVLIEIEDDGNGYPSEVLDYMKGVTKKTSDKGTRTGLWSIKNMMELMYERSGLVVLENTTPHGCLNRIYVPKEVKHERKTSSAELS